jgi:hypothetical protein
MDGFASLAMTAPYSNNKLLAVDFRHGLVPRVK